MRIFVFAHIKNDKNGFAVLYYVSLDFGVFNGVNEMATIYTTISSFDAANKGLTYVSVNLRNPARTLVMALPLCILEHIATLDSMATMLPTDTDAQAVEKKELAKAIPVIKMALISTLEDQLSTWAKSYTVVPTSYPDDKLTLETLISGATTSTSNWLSSDELKQLWETSATRQRMVLSADGADKYANNKTYRATVNTYAEMILKLAAKSVVLPQEDRDWIITKLADGDLTSPLGEFIARRFEQMAAKTIVPTIQRDLI